MAVAVAEEDLKKAVEEAVAKAKVVKDDRAISVSKREETIEVAPTIQRKGSSFSADNSGTESKHDELNYNNNHTGDINDIVEVDYDAGVEDEDNMNNNNNNNNNKKF